MPTEADVQRAVLEVLAPFLYSCQWAAPAFDVTAAVNRCLAGAGLPFYYVLDDIGRAHLKVEKASDAHE
jgi:hypothetical protein